jgi:hypothetical protein
MTTFLLPVRHEFSYAYYCPRCGEVWARLQTLGNGYYLPYTQRCVKHALDEEDLVCPGSLLLPPLLGMNEFFGAQGFDRLLRRLHPDHLKYEFTTALEWAQKGSACQILQQNCLASTS